MRETIQNLNKLSMRDGAESSPTRQTKGPIPTVIAVRPRSTAPKLEKSPVPPNGLQTPVIWISDTEDGNDEIFSADESHNCTGLGRWKSPGTTENNLKEQKCSDIEGFLKVEPSSVPWGYSNESEIENKDGGLSGSDLVRSARGPTRNGINSKSAGSVQTAPKSSVRADSSFDPKAASFGRVQKRVRHWISSQEASSSATEKVKRVKCESSHSVIVAVTSNDTKLPVSNTQNPSPKVIVPCQSSGLNRNIRRESTISEATTELIGSDIDSVSTGSDIPWMTEEKQTYNSSDVTREPWGDTKSPDNAPHGNRDEIRASMIERRGGGPKYSEREKNEGPAFVRSLLDKRCTIAEIETEYLREFMIFRTAAALFRRFDIKGTRWLIDRHRKARRLSEMVCLV